MDMEESPNKSRSPERGNKGSETSRNMLHSDEIRANSSGEITTEDPHKLPGLTESGNGDQAALAFGSSVDAVGSPQAEENPMGDGSIVVEAEINSNSSQSPPSATAVMDSGPPMLKKGSGLRKWRRIRREFAKDGSSNADSAQILKRRHNNTEPSKRHEESKLKITADADGDDSVASVESRNTEINPLQVGTGTLDPELEVLASSGFSIGMDSDNSEDHSSKSSTAASAPWLKNEAPRSGRERGKAKNFSGKGSTRLPLQKIQLGRGGTVDSTKKIRDDLARFEKENSLSSVESDLRSSVIGIMQWRGVVDSNGKHNGRSLKSDEHSDEAHTGEEVRSGYHKENRKAENPFIDDSDHKLLDENIQHSDNCQSNSELDPFMKSLVFLQEAQEVLEQEIEKMEVIGKEQVDSNELFEGLEASSSPTLEAHLIDLEEKVENLEAKLEEASTTMKTKEQKLCKLEAVLGELARTHVSSRQQQEEEASYELELLLKAKMEAEIEYFLLTRTTHNLKILCEDHLSLFREQKHLASDQEQTMLKLREAEEKTVKLSAQTHVLEEYCKEVAGVENVLRLQNKVCKFSLCFIVQMILLFIALGLFLVHLLSPADGVAPT